MRWPGPDDRAAPLPGPDRRVVSFPRPDHRAVPFPDRPLFAVSLAAPAVGGGLAGADVVFVPWLDAAAAGDGLAGAVLAVMTEIDAAAAGDGLAGAVFVNAEIAAPAVGGGLTGAEIVSAVSLAAPAVGGGLAGTAGYPVAVVVAAASAVGAGSAVIVPGVLIPASATGGGAAAALVDAAAVLIAPAVGGGTAAAAVVTFRPSGMTKVGTQQVTGTMTALTGWAADPAYPGSSVSGSALVVNGAKAGATVSARVQWTPGAGGNTVAVQLRRGGVVLATGTYVSASPSVVSWTGDVAAGDLITAEVRDSGSWAGTQYKATVAAGAGTYVRVE